MHIRNIFSVLTSNLVEQNKLKQETIQHEREDILAKLESYKKQEDAAKNKAFAVAHDLHKCLLKISTVESKTIP